MAESGKIYEIPIYLKVAGHLGGDSGGADEDGLSSDPQDGENEDQKAAAQASKSRTNPAKAILSRMVKQAAATALNNYGNITGDYISGQNLQTAIGEATAIAGAAAMGWVGIALYAIDKGAQAYNYIAQLKRSEAESAFKQKRVYAANRRS